MARKTEIEIEEMVYNALEPFFVGKISGSLYKSGIRPLDSNLEDAVILVGNTNAEQIQTGRARIHIYVQDIDNGSGRLVPDKDRLTELSGITDEVITVLNGADLDYSFGLAQATGTLAEPEIKQHFVNISMEFDCITF